MTKSVWTLYNDFTIIAKHIEEDWLVYHEGESTTHRLSGSAAHLFAVIWNNPNQRFSLDSLFLEAKKSKMDTDLSQIESVIKLLVNLNLISSVD